ncbi:hypothetical protein LOD99_14849 [Oopsacas minuta]|uniref:Uncharacterized protein n=1 Tax=Oopsacas minuta TaxID=111878 RepID=A0AAV7KE07_9METZ|nr:hypothetical protein LOD99_14849 [Oopsacas minuta]
MPFEKNVQIYTKFIGDNVSFRIFSSAINYFWSKDDFHLTNVTRNFLDIRNIKDLHFGVYVCRYMDERENKFYNEFHLKRAMSDLQHIPHFINIQHSTQIEPHPSMQPELLHPHYSSFMTPIVFQNQLPPVNQFGHPAQIQPHPSMQSALHTEATPTNYFSFTSPQEPNQVLSHPDRIDPIHPST